MKEKHNAMQTYPWSLQSLFGKRKNNFQTDLIISVIKVLKNLIADMWSEVKKTHGLSTITLIPSRTLSRDHTVSEVKTDSRWKGKNVWSV